MRTLGFLVIVFTVPLTAVGEWKALPALPDKEGFAGAYAGVSNNALLVAGGANFPERKPWEGGKKVWYDRVFVLEEPGGKWKLAGKLPRALGYGVSVTHKNSVICAGGNDATRHYADCFRLEWKDSKLVTTELPALPKPLANCCGAVVGDTLYIAGGQEKPDAQPAQTVYTLNLATANAKWQEIAKCPGSGRMLAVAASFDGAFWLIGGVDLVAGKEAAPKRKYLNDAYRYDPATGWKRIADLPHPLAAAPSPAPTLPSGFSILGGDDGTQLAVAPDKHRGFNKSILQYDAKGAKWVEVGTIPESRVTVACVLWRNTWIIPSGEIRPGVRTPQVAEFRQSNP